MKKYLIILVLLLSACTKFEPQIATQSIYYEDVSVQLSQLMVYSRPEKPHYGPLSALVYPFHVTQTMPNSRNWGRQISKGVWQNWTGLQIFPSMVYDDTLTYRGLKEALFTARARGYDLLIVGSVPYLYLGHTMDDSAVTIQVKIYETKRGMMICSFEQSGRIEKKMDDDFIIIKREHRMPDSSFYNIVNAIASDMAVPLTTWAKYEKKSQGIIRAMTPAPQIKEMEFPDQSAETPRIREMKSLDQSAEPPRIKEMKSLDQSAEAPQIKEMKSPDQSAEAPQIIEQNIPDEQKVTPAKANSVNLAVQFDSDSDQIKPESNGLLNELGKALISDKLNDKSIIIAGHTDSDASPEYNLKLSKERAESVKKYLTDNFPIQSSRIATTGFGESRPLVPNVTKYNKLLNRRVQVSVAP